MVSDASLSALRRRAAISAEWRVAKTTAASATASNIPGYWAGACFEAGDCVGNGDDGVIGGGGVATTFERVRFGVS